MHNTTLNGSMSFTEGQGEINETLPEKQRFFHFLKENTVTCTMVSVAIKAPQKNLTRYKRDYQKAGLLWEVKKDYCQYTGFKAWYLTTDRTKAPNAQLSLFDEQ